jgi:hypothetical protein
MNKDVVYRNIAALGGLFLIANTLFFSHQDCIVHLSKIIDLIVVPIAVLMASFWYKKNIVLLGVLLYFISYSNQIVAEFDMFSNSILFVEYQKSLNTIGIIALLMIIIGGVDRLDSNKSWLFKRIERPELVLTLTAIISFISLLAIFYSTN